MTLPKSVILIFTLFLTSLLLGQIDFNNYSGLYSSGEVPEDFTKNTLEKYSLEKEKNRKSKKGGDKLEKDFILSSNSGVDKILLSGMVVFNDPVSQYADKVLKEVMKSRPDLLESIRLYTIKSNEPNAFSTRQGILFVTTGLIAQLENEAQLAFVLAHEVAHYEKKHLIESYKENKEIVRGKGQYKYASYDEKIKYLSRYSKKKEFDADYVGLQYYKESNYSLDAIDGVFNVLLYSYLPFDEVVFNRTCYNDSALFIPDGFFPDEINKITASEDYEDSEGSHPNIKNRKDYIAAELEELKAQQKNGKNYIIGETEFNNVQNICRFESVRLSIIKSSPASALYSIYLLKKYFPNNYFLDKMEAISWYKLMKFKNEGIISEITYSKNEIEGESHALHYMVRDFSKKQLATVALKRIYTIDEKYGFDSLFIHSLCKDAVKDMIHEKIWKKDTYSEQTYAEAKNEFELSKVDLGKPAVVDSIEYVREKEPKTKFEKIEKKKKSYKTKTKAKTKDQEWDTEKFYIYGLADILDDVELKKMYQEAKEELEEEEDEEDLTYKEIKKIRKKIKNFGVQLGVEKALILSPEFQKWHFKKGYQNLQSEKGKIVIGEMYEKNCSKLGLDQFVIFDQKAIEKSEVDELNDISIVMDYVIEFISYGEEGGYITTEYDQIKKITQDRNFNYVVLPFIIVEEQKRISGLDYFALISPIYWPYLLVKAALPSSTILVTNVVFNLEENKVEYVFSKFFKRKLNNAHFVDAHIYDILFQMTAQKKKGGKQ